MVYISILSLVGCGEEEPPPPPLPPPPSGAVTHPDGTPSNTPPKVARPDSKLPPVAWVRLPRVPDIDGMPFTAEELLGHHLVVIAVPIATFATKQQGDLSFREALFAEWSLLPFDPTGSGRGGEFGPEALACRGAVSGLQGTLSLAVQRDPTTKKTYLRAANVSGNADAIHLVFLLADGLDPFLVRRNQEAIFACTSQENELLINRLFLPKRPPARWQEARVDLHDNPLVVANFGTCVEIRRETFLARPNQDGTMETVKPAPGHVYFSFYFAPQAAAFDFAAADWRLVFSNSSSVEPCGVSASNGKSFLLGVATTTSYSGGETTTPVLLFEGPADSSPVRLQFKTQSLELPK